MGFFYSNEMYKTAIFLVFRLLRRVQSDVTELNWTRLLVGLVQLRRSVRVFRAVCPQVRPEWSFAVCQIEDPSLF